MAGQPDLADVLLACLITYLAIGGTLALIVALGTRLLASRNEVEEAEIEQSRAELQRRGEGWFVVNMIFVWPVPVVRIIWRSLR